MQAFNRAFFNRQSTGGGQYEEGYSFSGTLSGIVETGGRYPLSYNISSELSASAELRIEYREAYAFLSSLSGSALMATDRETVMNFMDLVIAPGSELVIDSETFTIYLDGENVIDRYEGDWLFFDRTLRELEVSEDLTVSVLYRRRYL